jgi:hypothetical protein
MTTLNNAALIQTLVTDGNVQLWIDRLLRSKRGTWQRNEAEVGLRATVNLLVGINRAVAVDVSRRVIDTAIVIDGLRVPMNFVRQQPA